MKTREVVFYSEGAKMVGDIYLPDDYKEGEKRPAVLCNSGWTGVNKCYPALFARALTARGCNKAAEFVNFWASITEDLSRVRMFIHACRSTQPLRQRLKTWQTHLPLCRFSRK